jgi:hypothetical protein
MTTFYRLMIVVACAAIAFCCYKILSVAPAGLPIVVVSAAPIPTETPNSSPTPHWVLNIVEAPPTPTPKPTPTPTMPPPPAKSLVCKGHGGVKSSDGVFSDMAVSDSNGHGWYEVGDYFLCRDGAVEEWHLNNWRAENVSDTAPIVFGPPQPATTTLP